MLSKALELLGNGGARPHNDESALVKVSFCPHNNMSSLSALQFCIAGLQESSPEELKMHKNSWRRPGPY